MTLLLILKKVVHSLVLLILDSLLTPMVLHPSPPLHCVLFTCASQPHVYDCQRLGGREMPRSLSTPVISSGETVFSSSPAA